MSSPYIPNPWNQVISQKHGLLAKAKRFALGTLCDPATGAPVPTDFRRQLKLVQVNANAVGDNIIIPALAGVKQIYELVMWNVSNQSLVWQQGATGGGQSITLLQLPSFPSLTGFILGFNGSFEMPHWEIDNGQSLVLNASAGTQVTGFIRYRVQNGTG